MTTQTYYGPKTMEEALETIERYESRIAKRPSSAARYEAHIRHARKVIRTLSRGGRFDIATQQFVID